ncbi:MAG: F0F1 ATP synthase subunit delta [bacterium]|nr:F0F1 ATP synthase subunit delta [bacterium]
MKYPIKIYARSLAELLVGRDKKQQEAILNNFIILVKKNRDGSKLKKILDLAQLAYLKKTGRSRVVFECARTGSDLKTLKSILKEGDIAEERMNPNLIAGVKVIIDGEKQFDCSLANKLKNI